MKGSEILAGFTPGAQDTLRKATAKKKQELIQALRYVFIYGSQEAVKYQEAHIEELRQKGLSLTAIEPHEKALKEIKELGNTIPGGLAKGYSREFLEAIYNQWVKFSGLIASPSMEQSMDANPEYAGKPLEPAVR